MISASVFRDYVNQSKPIEIFLADGRKVEVPHGEYLSLHPSGRMFLLWRPEGGFELFNLTMVTSIALADDQKPKQRKKA